ncbi:hypothetical protein TSUD_173670 [Trifolium subterraneum]|nr:hypothetical protein TSUD_173670 [Trifolium subterraneum]
MNLKLLWKTQFGYLFNIPAHISHSLSSTVSDYIVNGLWNIPPQLSQAYTTLGSIVHQVTIPMEPSQDKLLWKHTDSGDLQLKEAYHFKTQQFQDLYWASTIWSPDIPPSKSFLAWRLMHDKVPTDENLILREFGPDLLVVLMWSFNLPHWKTCNNTCKSSSNSIRDFTFLKLFRISIKHPKISIIKEVCWEPPLVNWTKCNIDGAACGNPGFASCGGIFRNFTADFVFGFAEPLGIVSPHFAELCGAMRAIEIAYQNNWNNLWLETDSTLVVSAFQNPAKPIAWALRNKWQNVLLMLNQMNCIVTHIYREGYQVADLIANHGLSLPSIVFWDVAPMFISQTDNYIIHMNITAMPKPFLTQHTWYISTLSSVLENPQLTTTKNLISSKFIYTYKHVINGFSANLSPKEHEALKNSLGYISSVKDLRMKVDTTYSPKFLGLKPNIGAWYDSKYGEGIIIGLVDSGIWPESKSFNDNQMSKIPSKWKGRCENSIHFNSSLCNKKLIGAKFFNKGLLTKKPNATLGLNSTRDTLGHGTHTSSTAAGSRVASASYFGYASGTASGVASSSHVAMYKALWKEADFSSDVIAAIDAAISDGVDILSLSFGSTKFVPLYEDPLAIATFAAMEKGVFVSCAAGNGGPDLETLHNGMPWVITVAAGTMDRDFQGTLTLGNGNKVMGFSLYLGTLSSHNVPIVFMGLCDNANELKNVKRMIVVCEDKNGTSLSGQLYNLDEAKVYGAVLISNAADTYYSSDDYIIGFQNSLAAIFVDPIHGEVIKAYIKSYYNSKHSSIASMSFRKTGFGLKTAPSVDSYSSRGPSYSCPFVLKPDITAPGTLILAAWPTNVTVAQKYFRDFNLETGTSMACPHVAGVAALVKGAHRNWSPAAIRSAIMTTSDILDNTKEHIKDIGTDYVNLLCALNYTQKNITAITKSSSNDCSKPSLDLNYPSFIAFFNGENSSSKSMQEFHRTVTNVGEGQATYVASITPIKGFRVTVIPNKLVFNEKNEKLSFKLRIEVSTTTKLKEVDFGYLTWMDRKKHVVRSPIVVTTLKLKS